MSLGQAALLLERERIDDDVRARLPAAEREGLAAVEEALAEARRIGLAPSSSYRHLIDREGRPLVTLVVAAPPDRLEAQSWWFPIVGSVPYLGFFDPRRARRFARSLEADGLETFVRPALLYSTLGWFDDPLPRSVLVLDRIDLLDTILHERVHQTVFEPGDVEYNEALATFVAEQGTLARLELDPVARAEAARRFADRRRFGELLERLAAELEALYARDGDVATARAELFRRYQQVEYRSLPWETMRYEAFLTAPLSNAYLVAQRTYLGRLPCFERELEALGGDLRALVRAHAERPGRDAHPCEP